MNEWKHVRDSLALLFGGLNEIFKHGRMRGIQNHESACSKYVREDFSDGRAKEHVNVPAELLRVHVGINPRNYSSLKQKWIITQILADFGIRRDLRTQSCPTSVTGLPWLKVLIKTSTSFTKSLILYESMLLGADERLYPRKSGKMILWRP